MKEELNFISQFIIRTKVKANNGTKTHESLGIQLVTFQVKLMYTITTWRSATTHPVFPGMICPLFQRTLDMRWEFRS